MSSFIYSMHLWRCVFISHVPACAAAAAVRQQVARPASVYSVMGAATANDAANFELPAALEGPALERGSDGRVAAGLTVEQRYTLASNRVTVTRVDLCYHCRPFPECVGEGFNHLSVQRLFLRTYEDIYGYIPFHHCKYRGNT
jgi:hypothetical protein